jgi:catechol 2,3-dioxygenase-like lactoylglutathione lyase family enzyme
MRVLAIDHVQLAMPAGGESKARAFYGELLGLTEIARPESLRSREGVWFRAGAVRVHLGVDAGFQPARKAHPCFEVDALAEALARCRTAGMPVADALPIAGIRRCYVSDPFGNRIELMERTGPETRE